MLTKKGKYGLKAVVYLAGLAPGHSAAVAHIAGANNIPKTFLDAILRELRLAGLLQSRKGKNGGYMLARPSDSIMVGDILRVLEGPFVPFRCANRTNSVPCADCDIGECSVRVMMLQVWTSMAEILEHKTLADMRAHSAGRMRSW